MEEKIEMIPIAIPEINYNQNMANLVEQLLIIDEKLFKSQIREAKWNALGYTFVMLRIE